MAHREVEHGVLAAELRGAFLQALDVLFPSHPRRGRTLPVPNRAPHALHLLRLLRGEIARIDLVQLSLCCDTACLVEQRDRLLSTQPVVRRLRCAERVWATV